MREGYNTSGTTDRTDFRHNLFISFLKPGSFGLIAIAYNLHIPGIVFFPSYLIRFFSSRFRKERVQEGHDGKLETTLRNPLKGGKKIDNTKYFSKFANYLSNVSEMSMTKADIIARLQRDILPLQGFKPITSSTPVDVGLGRIKHAFPGASFPLGAVHEFCCAGLADAAPTIGFIAGIVGTLMRKGGVTVWISSSRTIFPLALKSFGIEPDKIIFIDLQKQKDVLWVMEEALKCDGLAAVVGEINELSFTASRRLQLAVEQSRVTGFVVRCILSKLNTTACMTRWKITSLPSVLDNGIPGVGFPCWNVELLKVRNGRPGSWQVEWRGGRFSHLSMLTAIHSHQQKKTG